MHPRIQPLRCSYCRRQFGWANFAEGNRNQSFCSDWCARESIYGAERLRERNDIWRMLVALGLRPTEVARLWGVDHSNVFKTIQRNGARVK